MFREQVSTVSNWFDRWSACEQTVAIVALIRRLHPTQSRFIATILHKQLHDSPELRRQEILANDPNFVASLVSTESNDTLMRDMLAYLPLLNPKNQDVKTVYLALLSKVLKYAMDHCTLHDEARQLLSYSLIHPAFQQDDRQLFSTLLHQFEEKIHMSNDGHNIHYSSSLSGSPPSMNDFNWQQNSSPPNNGGSLSGSPGTQSVLSISNFPGSTNLQRIRRSNSLTPPVIHSDNWNAQEEFSGKPRSLSLSSEVSPQGSLASSGSGSESHLDDQRPTFTAPGMKDIPCWLKSLRLHKYSFLFAHLTFEEMITLNEEQLEKQGVTKGARHKIILSIAKLKERPSHLIKLYEDLKNDKESLRNALTEIKWMLTTPIKPVALEDETKDETTNPSNPPGPIGSNRFQQPEEVTSTDAQKQPTGRDNEDDIADKIIKVIGKACEMNPDSECEGLLISILDRCLTHEAFTSKQKRLLALWRQQQAPMMRRNSSGHHPHFHNHHHRTSSNPGSNNGKHGRHFNPRVLNLPSSLGTGSWTSTGNSIHAMFMAKRPSLQDSILESVRNSHLSVQRTKSAPLPNFFSLSSSPPMFEHLGSMGNPSDILAGLNFGTDPAGLIGGSDVGTSTGPSGIQQSSAMDITSRLESLCLSMTEAALGPAFSSY